eukprot:s5277_g3.t1
MSVHADRLVELFLQSARGDASGASKGAMQVPDDEGIQRAIAHMEAMLTSEDAANVVGSPAATFVCLGMALEEKPKLQPASVSCYEKALEYVGRAGHPEPWEHCVLLQQLGAVCLRLGRLKEADKRLGCGVARA